MKAGKKKCEALRKIRETVASKLGLDYEPKECTHEGDCTGTCPQCEAELANLNRQMREKGITDIDIESIMEFPKIDEPDHGTPLGGQPASPDREHDMDPLFHTPGIPVNADEWERMGDPGPMFDFRPVSRERRLFKRVYIAGLAFHDVDEFWDELCVGARLALVPQPDNEYDKNAVAIAFECDFDPDEPEEFDFRFILGYVPRDQNAELSALLNMGWREVLSAEIAELNRHAPMKERIAVDIYIESKEKIDPTEQNRLFVLKCADEEARKFKAELMERGTVHFRWGGFPTWENTLPDKGQKVLIGMGRDNDFECYLMKVLAIGSEAAPFIKDRNELHMVDDCEVFVLSNIQGPVSLPESALGKDWPERFPDKLSIMESYRIYEILQLPVNPSLTF